MTQKDKPAEPFDEKAWRKRYMKEYMRRWRERVRAEKARGRVDPPPPKGEACADKPVEWRDNP